MPDKSIDELRKLINTYHQWEYAPEENGWSCVLCAEIVIYLDPWRDSLQDNRDGTLDFYEQAMALVKDDLKWVLINGEGHFRKVTKKVFEMIPFWVSPQGPDGGRQGLDMQCGPERDSRTEKSFSFSRSTRSHLCLTLPLEYMLEDPQRFADLAQSMVRRLKFGTGNAGFSVNMALNGIGPDSTEGSHIYMLSRRFDGLNLGIPWDSSDEGVLGLRTINWLTFVGDGIAERMQGRKGVKAALPSDIPVTDLDHGLMIQAGPRPILGDVNAQEDIADYYRVGGALKALAFKPPVVNGRYNIPNYTDHIGGRENTERWYKRFFQG